MFGRTRGGSGREITPRRVPILNDSKVNRKQRYALREEIERVAAYGVAECSPEEIDQWNILNTSITAMHRALDKLQLDLDGIAVMEIVLNPINVPYHTHIKGDGRFLNIAAASILAKTYRDDFMKKMALTFPQYAWEKIKDIQQRRIVRPSKPMAQHNRKSFRLLPEQLQIEF